MRPELGAREDRELHGLLVKHRPSSPTGAAAHKSKTQVVNNVNDLPKRAMGNTRAYIEQRLQAKFREAMKEQGRRTDFPDNVRGVSEQACGNSKAYTCERLRRESPSKPMPQAAYRHPIVSVAV